MDVRPPDAPAQSPPCRAPTRCRRGADRSRFLEKGEDRRGRAQARGSLGLAGITRTCLPASHLATKPTDQPTSDSPFGVISQSLNASGDSSHAVDSCLHIGGRPARSCRDDECGRTLRDAPEPAAACDKWGGLAEATRREEARGGALKRRPGQLQTSSRGQQTSSMRRACLRLRDGL